MLDVSLHTKGMSVDEAVGFLVEECQLEPVNALAEVRRYIQTSMQPQSHLMGKLALLDIVTELRAARPELSMRELHDAILGSGSLSPRLMRQQLGLSFLPSSRSYLCRVGRQYGRWAGIVRSTQELGACSVTESKKDSNIDYWHRVRQAVGKDAVIIPSAAGTVIHEGKSLLVRHILLKKWPIPGGLQEIGESVQQEVQEEV